MFRSLIAAILLLLAANCTNTNTIAEEQDILLVGDSVMSWNRSINGDVGSQLQQRLGRNVTSEATPGARLRATGVASFGGLSIDNQLKAGTWNWIVMNGGANDLGRNCGCTRCAEEIELLMSEDGTKGVIPNLVRQAQGYGAKVVWIGYYQAPQSRAFRGCRPGLVELERRIASYAMKTQGFFFTDSEDVFNPSNRELYANDQTHPSVLGSSVIAELVASTITTNNKSDN